MAKCPGQDQRFWKPKDIFEIKCPECSNSIEFWKDDPQIKCSGCKKLITNPRLDISCAKWCKYAKECLGVSAVKSDSALCNMLVEDMKTICKDNRPLIDHAIEVLNYAEQIQSDEGGSPLVVKAAAILHEVDICTNPDKCHDPVIAREVLAKHGIEPAMIEQICQIIIASRQGNELDNVEFNIITDAHQLAESQAESDEKATDKTFKTDSAKRLAKEAIN